MNNPNLAADYKLRALGRRGVVEYLIAKKLYADAVRESQEALELALKAVIRECGHPVPFTHDVSSVLKQIELDLPEFIRPHLNTLCNISKSLRRDRELAFYGSEDITPSEFYTESDAQKALEELNTAFTIIALG